MKYILLLFIVTTYLFAKDVQESIILKGALDISHGNLESFMSGHALEDWRLEHCRNDVNGVLTADTSCIQNKIEGYLRGTTKPNYTKRVSTKFDIFTYQFSYGQAAMATNVTFLFNKKGSALEWVPIAQDSSTSCCTPSSKVRSVRGLPHNRLWVEVETEGGINDGNDKNTFQRLWLGYLFGLDESGALEILAWRIPILESSYKKVDDYRKEVHLSPKQQVDVMILEGEIRITKLTETVSESQERYLGSFFFKKDE